MLAKQIYIGTVFVLFMGGMVAKVVTFRKKQGIDPVPLLSAASGLDRYIGRLFAALILYYLAVGGLLVIRPGWISFLHPFPSIDVWEANLSGFVLSLGSLAFISSAQVAMGSSWRIGIDRDHETGLVRAGVFRYCRNPMYAGMILLTWGVFLIVPSVAAVLGAVVCYLVINVQVRLEEDHLEKAHGEAYRKFARDVGRFLPRFARSKED